MGIGEKISRDLQLQEFVERCMSQMFDICRSEDYVMSDICDDIGITEDEAYWMFEQLGYTRKED